MKLKQIHKDPSVPENFPNGRKEETACALYGSNASLIKQAFTIKKYDRDHDTDYSKFGLDGNARASQLLKLISDGQNYDFIKHMVEWLSKTEPTYLNAKEHVISKGKSKKTPNAFSKYEEMYDRITKGNLSKRDKEMVDNANKAMGIDNEDDVDVSESMPTEHERYNDVKPHITWTSKPSNNVKVVVIGKPTINVARAIAIQLQDNGIREDAYSVMMVDEDILNYIHDMTDKAKYLNIPSMKSDITGIVDQSNTIPYKLRELKVGSIPDELCDETFFDSQFEHGSECQDVG